MCCYDLVCKMLIVCQYHIRKLQNIFNLCLHVVDSLSIEVIYRESRVRYRKESNTIVYFYCSFSMSSPSPPTTYIEMKSQNVKKETGSPIPKDV